MIEKTPRTFTKGAKYDDSLEETVKKLSEQFFPVSITLGNTTKYAYFEKDKEPYLLMVSQQKDKLVAPAGYNVIVTISSYSESRNKEIAKKFEQDTGISLDIDVPNSFKNSYSLFMGICLQVFEKDPEEGEAILSRG